MPDFASKNEITMVPNREDTSTRWLSAELDEPKEWDTYDQFMLQGLLPIE